MRCHLCTACCTSSLKALITHWRVFHNLVENSEYECTLLECGRRFPSLNSLKRHFKLEHNSYFPLTVNAGSSSGIGAANNSNTSTTSDLVHSNNSYSTCAILDDGDVSVPSTSKDALAETAFPDIVKSQVQRMICNFYSKPSIPRNFVQCVIDEFDSFVTCPIQMLEDLVQQVLIRNSVSLEDRLEVHSNFAVLSSVIKANSTEHLRFKNLREAGLYIDPHSHLIGQEFEVSQGKEVPKDRCAQVIPLRDLLKAFLETDGVLNHILEYMASFDTKSTVVANIVQAELWKQTIQNFDGKICLPLAMYFDEYETGNNLGSHSGVHKIGGAYIIMLCIPPEYRSRLKNIFLAMLLHHSDHKKAGNRVAFAKLIEEFKYLAEEGIVIETITKKVRIYFVLAVVEGDNQGLNTILGYSESFSANYYCRLCRLPKAEAQYATEIHDAYLRNEINYNIDVASHNFQTSGVKENCVFNDIPYYHCVRNVIADTMHDLQEGVLPYETGLIFHQLVLVDKVIDFDHFNAIIRNFNYQFETCKPCLVTREQLRSKYIKMSAAEMLTFFTYLPIMFGRFVPEDNIYWQLLIKMRHILSLLTSSSFDSEWLDLLDNLIAEHHAQYIQLFGPLKPKHHFMLHYSHIVKMMGPLVHIQSIRGEAKHREGKSTANSVSTRVNICKTIAIKQQLILCNRLLLNNGFDSEFESGRLRDFSAETADALTSLTNYIVDDYLATDMVKIYNTQYKCESVVSIDGENEFPAFARIKEILISCKDNDILFFCDTFETISFWEHIFAHEVRKTCKQIFVRQSKLVNHRPVLICEDSGKFFTVRISAVQ